MTTVTTVTILYNFAVIWAAHPGGIDSRFMNRTPVRVLGLAMFGPGFCSARQDDEAIPLHTQCSMAKINQT